MSNTPDDDATTDADADRQAAAMKDQLKKDVAMWSSARADGSTRQQAESNLPAARQSPAPSARRATRTKPVASAAKPAPGPKKPFGMSYDGVPQADYITYMIARGAR